MLFKDRRDAGKQLAAELVKHVNTKDAVIVGLARGGMVIADEIAARLNLPLNVIVVRKIGAPGNPELALGAIAESGEGIFNQDLIDLLGVSVNELEKEIARQKQILKARLELYRGKSSVPNFKGKTVILADDGIATGASMRVAIQSIRSAGAKKIVLTVPVAAPDSLRKIEKEVDGAVCLLRPSHFEGVGGFYEIFEQTSDDEVIQILSKASRR